MQETKYYIRSNGEKIPMEQVHFEHLSNGYAKKCRTIFEYSNKEQLENAISELKDIEEEIKKRINEYGNKIGGNND